MNKICKICGYAGENTWRDGKYYCASCGSEIDVTQTENAQSSNGQATNTSGNAVPIQVVCPICKNDKNNYLQNSQCHCSLCGSTFSPNQSYGMGGAAFGASVASARKAELEQKKSKRLKWGIVFLFLCWPVAIYHFYKLYEITQEISKL